MFGFGRKAKEIARLTQENQGLRQQAAAVEGDPYYLIARELGAEVEGIISSGQNTDRRVTDAIARRRAALFLAGIDVLAQAEIDKQTAQQKAEIDRQALVEANELAAAALQRFLSGGGAAAYREKIRARLNRQRPDAVLRQAKQQIAAEEHSRLVEESKARLLAMRAEDTEREQMKRRAQELRGSTRKTRMLHLEQLQDGDPLTIAFTQSGQGFQPLTEIESYSGSSVYRSQLEGRKVSGHLVDSATGIFEIENDSWIKEPDVAEQALRYGQQVQFLARDPVRDEEGAVSPCLVKGAPLSMQTLGGVALPDGGLDVWWVNLGDFRALS